MKNQLKTLMLLGALSAILVGIGGAIGPTGLVLFTILALAMNVGAYFFSDRLVLRSSGAREVTAAEAPDLHSMVEELALRADIPKPRVCVIPSPEMNAFATGRNPKNGVVAVTEGIVRALSRRELRGVIAHELAHIKNRDILVATIAAATASIITSIANALTWTSIFSGGQSSSEEGEEGSGGGSGLLMALVAPIAATLVQLGISRSREYLADETGSEISGDPEALASALLKLEQRSGRNDSVLPAPTASLCIVSPFAGGSVATLFSTHPAIAERVRRLLALSATKQPSIRRQAELRSHL